MYPVLPLAVPGAHRSHVVWPMLYVLPPYVPAGHGEHIVLPLVLVYVTAMHEGQEVWPVVI